MEKNKILVVDDAKLMQKVAGDILSSKYDVVFASSGEEAIILYGKEKPDLVLADLYMPKMTGLELLEELKNRYQTQIPIMFMTADESNESESRGLRSGALDYIRKPFTPEVLLRRVDNIISNANRIQDLRTVAETDAMTGLFNKAYAHKVIAEACLHTSGILMMIDLDSFKLVNDLYGHDMGDRVLIRFSEIIRGAIRSTDLAGRVGGDEFIVFCQDIKEEKLVAEKTRQMNEALLTSAREFMGEDMTIPLGVSVGAVCVPEEGSDFTELYKKADRALYIVKQNGKHGYSIYHGDTSHGEDGHGTAVGSFLENTRMILEERNRARGAYELGFEHFQSVYRFLMRLIESYHIIVGLASISLYWDETSDLSEEEAFDLFADILAKSLRRSDVYTKYGKGRFLVLFSEMENDSGEMILSRVRKKWISVDKGRGAKMTWDMEVISEHVDQKRSF